MDITNVFSNEELIETINVMEIPEDKYVKLILVGNRKIEIDKNNILKYIDKHNIIKIEDKTKIEIDLEILAVQNNLKGIFIRMLLEKQRLEPENKEKIAKAIEIGLSVL